MNGFRKFFRKFSRSKPKENLALLQETIDCLEEVIQEANNEGLPIGDAWKVREDMKKLAEKIRIRKAAGGKE